MLLEPPGLGLANRVDDVLDALPAALEEHTAPETHATGCAASCR